MTHGQLDDLLRAGARHDAFSPAEAEWAEMTALLEADERRARGARWVSGVWAVLFLALIGIGIYGACAYAPADRPVETSREVPIYTHEPAGSGGQDTEAVAKTATAGYVDYPTARASE